MWSSRQTGWQLWVEGWVSMSIDLGGLADVMGWLGIEAVDG